ncbi:MAG: oligosaccharide flippase family protein [Gammaproteobacteria bacterium]|nr:oligosaccharide flippase family protein [Gammaproteobacteria bacterium]
MSTAKGLAWFFFNTAFAKSLTFITQLVLGWLLVPNDFGLYAIAVSVGIFVGMMRNGGVEQVLIQKGKDFSEILPTAASYSLSFNILAMLAFLAIAPTVSNIYDDSRLLNMLIIMSLVLPAGTPAVLYRAKLSIDRRYKELALLKTTSASIRQIMVLVFALNGYGVYSFVLPMIIEVLIEVIIGYYYTRISVTPLRFDLAVVKNLFLSCKWMMLASVMLGLATTGDFFLLGLFISKEQLGIYFFGLQLVVAVSTVFSTAIQGVMLPALMPVVNDPKKFTESYTQALSKIFFISMPLAVVLSASSQPIIHWAWNGKWDEAINISQIMFLGMPFWLMVFLSRSSLEALGLWKKRLAYLGVYGILSMTVAVLFAQTSNLVYIAAGVALTRGIIGVAQSFSIFSIVDQSKIHCAKQMGGTLLITVLSATLALICKNITPEIHFLIDLVVYLMVFSTMYIGLTYKLQPSNLSSVLAIITSIRQGDNKGDN